MDQVKKLHKHWEDIDLSSSSFIIFIIFIFYHFIFFSFGNRCRTKLIAMEENSPLTHGLTATSDHRFGHKLRKHREERFSQPSDVNIVVFQTKGEKTVCIITWLALRFPQQKRRKNKWKKKEDVFNCHRLIDIPLIWRSNSHSQKHHHVTSCQKTYRGCLSTDQIISSMKMTFIWKCQSWWRDFKIE